MNPIYKFKLSLTAVTSNLLNPDAVMVGFFVSWTYGYLQQNASYAASDFIPVIPGQTYKIINKNNTAYSSRGGAFYDSQKNFVSGYQSASSITIPAGCYWIRITLGATITFADYSFCLNSASFEYYGLVGERIVFPLYSGDLTKEYALESGQQFLRPSLNGDLTFLSDDYDFIVAKSIDTQFNITIYISFDGGASWTETWTGQFWKTDCTFNQDAETCVVRPALRDIYTDILNGWEREFNLIELAPKIENVKIDKRPMIQVYVPGQTVIGCFLAGMGWEQECNAVDSAQALQDTYHFYPIKTIRVAQVTQQGSPTIPDVFAGAAPSIEGGTYTYTNSGYRLHYDYETTGGVATQTWEIIRVSDSAVMWRYVLTGQGPQVGDKNITLTAVSGSGTVKLFIHDMPVYARYVCDVETINGTSTYAIPDDDIVPNNRNYHRVIGYNFPDTILYSVRLSSTPTPYGIYQPNQYYDAPAGAWYFGEVFPIARSAWGRVSLWFTFSAIDWLVEESARAPFVLKDAYPLASVISVLLEQIAPNVTHQQNTNYSQFLYGTNPITGIQTIPIITPKSNLIYAGYDQPAQRAPITLKKVLDMLRDCFRCYWYIDSGNRLRIEHIKYFNNGMSYSGTPGIGVDLTTIQVPRNGKKWAFGKDAYKYDKPDMPSRYQFGWMDEQTQLFDGYPMDILSKFVQADRIENIDVQQFSSDVDYILLNPSVISKDGFVLMLCVDSSIATQTWTNIINSPEFVPVTEPGFHVNILDLSNYRGKTVRVTLTATNIVPEPGHSAWVGGYTSDENGNFLAYVLSMLDDAPTTTAEFVVESNCDHLALYSGGTYDVTLQTAQYLSDGSTQQILGLPYVNLTIQGNDHYLQNGYAAFAYLQRFYLYDMPALSYSVNGETKIAYGVKKLKTQEVEFPQIAEPNLQQLIKTNLGNGKIRKMSLNLSSRSAKTTLEYDTQ